MRLFEFNESITLWHGGRDLESDYRDLKSHKKGRWEHGPGLYLTDMRDTAAKYARGGGRLYRVTIGAGREIGSVEIDIEDAITFVKRNVVGRLRSIVIEDLRDNLARVGKLYAEVLVNLCLNHEAIPNTKTDRLRSFLIDNGVDYTKVTRYGGRDETVYVVINPRIIQKVENMSGKINEDEEAKLKHVATGRVNFPEADFWIIRKGSADKVGQPTREFSPEHIGIKVIETDIIIPDYLRYLIEYKWSLGEFKKLSHGNLKLVNIRVADVMNISLKT